MRYTFDNPGEAARYLASRYGCQSDRPRTHELLADEFPNTSVEAGCEAVRLLAREYFGKDAFTPLADAVPAALEPTYTKSSGQTVRVRDMASTHIRNAVNKYPGMPRGLRVALLSELRARRTPSGDTREYR